MNDLPKLAAPAQRALAGAGITSLKQLTKLTEAELSQLHGMGQNALGKLRETLKYKGLSFAKAGNILKGKKGELMKKADAKDELPPSQQIDKFIKELTDWRGKWIAKFRNLILKTAPEVTEDWKWGVPVWVYNGNVVASGVFKDHVKLNFFKGASLSDPKGLFNAGLDAKATRAIDIGENDKIDENALKELIRAAVAFNNTGNKKK